jgi:hypothetical protein
MVRRKSLHARRLTKGHHQKLDTTQQIQAIRRQIRSQDKKQDARLKEVKRMVRDKLKDHIAEHMK